MRPRITVRDITPRHHGYVLERFEAIIDPTDDDALADLLRRTAKRHNVKPGDIELEVYDGRHNPTVRV